MLPACLLALANAASSAEPDRAAAEEPAAGTAVQPAAAATFHGLKVYLDPETGELTSTPTREQIEALTLRDPLARSFEGLRTFALRDGGEGVYLQGRFRSATVVRALPGGGFETHCSEDPAAVTPLLQPAAAAAPVER